MSRIDASFGAVFRYEWRTNRLPKMIEYYSPAPGSNPTVVEIQEPIYEAGSSYLTGRSWSRDSIRYVANLEHLAKVKQKWIQPESKAQHREVSGADPTTVLYSVAGRRQERYLLRFINRSDHPALPFLRRRRRILDTLNAELQATIDLEIADRRITSLRDIARSTVRNIHEPTVSAHYVELAASQELANDFLYVASTSGTTDPTFVHRSGIFELQPIVSETLQKIAEIRDENESTPTENTQAIGDYIQSRRVPTEGLTGLPKNSEFLWVKSDTGDTTGVLLTTVVWQKDFVLAALGELELLQAYCDLLTTSIDGMTTYISEDGARKALGYIGHEIGTPFTILGDSAIKVTLDSMNTAARIRDVDKKLADQMFRDSRKTYQVIQKNRDDLDRVMAIAPILASMGSGILKMYFRSTDLSDIFSRAKDQIASETRGYQHTTTLESARRPRFEIHVTDSMARLPIVVCDEGFVLQAAMNLLRNAVKYSLPRYPPEPMVVTVSGRTIDHRTLAVTIENWGVGIPPDLQSKIFLPFVRGQVDDRLKSLPGMGLGLYLVRTIMGAHNGSVGCRSVGTLDDPVRNANLEGWHTTFEIRFRRDLVAGPQSVPVSPHGRQSLQQAAGER